MPMEPIFSVIVMAKAAVPGRVKTRLTRGPGGLTPEAAAAVHAAMLDTVLERAAGRVAGGGGAVLALDDVHRAPDAAAAWGWRVVEQGTGDLGERIARVWRGVAGPAMVLGVDSPDVPRASLRPVRDLLYGETPADHPPTGGVGRGSAGPGGEGGDAPRPPAARPPTPGPSRGAGGRPAPPDALLGPVADGGYWTLAARAVPLALLESIDWGTPAVYDQTHAAARAAGLRLADLPGWHDVDDTADLAALRRRLADPSTAGDAPDPALRSLARRLDALLGPAPIITPPCGPPP